MSNDKQPHKEFGLTQSELIVIQEYNRVANTIMGVFLSHLVNSRFGYNVTQNTRFEVVDGKLLVSEDTVPDSQSIEPETKLETA